MVCLKTTMIFLFCFLLFLNWLIEYFYDKIVIEIEGDNDVKAGKLDNILETVNTKELLL